MEIGKIVAAHHQFPRKLSGLQGRRNVKQTALVTLNLMRETALQGIPHVVEPLLRVAYAVQQLAAQRARAAIDLALKIDDIRDNQFGGSARGRRAQICDKVANGKVDFVTHSRDDWHGGMEYRARNDLFIELPQNLRYSRRRA